MLWQPPLPTAYRTLSPDEMRDRITARRRELGDSLVILGHHYQTDDVIRHADVTGDSLKLSQVAAQLASERDVKYIIFCGVHFMAETADMLTPAHVAVILPDLSAGCSMADMASYDDTVTAWETMHASLRSGGWTGRIVPVTYVNSSASIKSFVGEHGGACCTSSNARAVYEWASKGGDVPARPGENIKVLFLPDQHLGRNTASAAGVDVVLHAPLYDPRASRAGAPLGGMTDEQLHSAKIVLWAGHCSVHKLFRPEHCEQIRAENASSKTNEEPTRILVHPECSKEVVDLADFNGSTEYIIRTIADAPAGSRWAVGTEVHLVTRIAARARERGVHVRILSDCQCLCTTMYRIDEPHILWVLDSLAGALSKDGAPRIVNQISVHPQVRAQALLALERMLTLSSSMTSTRPLAERIGAAD